jgi:hypothetical protein
LYPKPEKYEFYWPDIKYLGLIISMEAMKIDPEKTIAV